MNFAICTLSVIPVRSEASDKSEMVSQLLFGEMLEVVHTKGSWSKIRCLWDDYTGWVDAKQIKWIDEETVGHYKNQYAISLELFHGVMAEQHALPITLGATLPLFDGIKFQLNKVHFTFSGQAIEPKKLPKHGGIIIKLARKYLYAPYLWGGRSPLGIDCSGFTQMVFKILNIPLPRDAAQQVEKGRVVEFNNLAQTGDLAFFENKKGKITHVGIILPENKIIHASGRVRIDNLDHYGIFNEELKAYTHQLRVIKRILETETPKEDLEIPIALTESKEQFKLF